MTETSVYNRKVNGGLVLLCVLNALALRLAVNNLEQVLTILGLDHSTCSALQAITRASVFGLLLGQLACLGLWFSLSNRPMRDKLRIYFWFGIILVGALTFLGWDGVLWPMLHFLGLAIAMPYLIAAGLRWSSRPIRIVELEKRSVTRSRIGITLVQMICASAAIAFCSVTFAASTRIFDTYATLVCFVVFWSASCSVLAVAGLMLTLQLKPQSVPVGLGLATILLVEAVSFYEGNESSFAFTLWDYFICFAWLATLPMIFVWLAPRFGFVVEAEASSPATKQDQSPLSDIDPFANDAISELSL